jgi:Fur family transcriptional regulator, ferric uptake regulator
MARLWPSSGVPGNAGVAVRPPRRVRRNHLSVDTPTPRREIRAVSTESSREKFKAFLADKGLRITNQRLAIFDAAFAQTEHFTAEGLLVHARAIDESVSRATVYRTLPIMTESALLREIDIGRNIKFYTPNRDNRTQQAQIICLDCEKIFEINAPFMEWYGTAVSSKLGLTPVSQRLQVSAHCNAYQATGKCPHHHN